MGRHRIMRNVYRYGLASLLFAVFAVFLLWPIALTVRGGFEKPEGASVSDTFIIFDYRGPDDFKYAGLRGGAQRWVVGHQQQGVWNDLVEDARGARAGRVYELGIRIAGSRVSMHIDQQADRLVFDFAQPLTGRVGLAAADGPSRFVDLNIRHQALVGGSPVGSRVMFDDHDDLRRMQVVKGDWRIVSNRLVPQLARDQSGLILFEPASQEPINVVHVKAESVRLSAYTMRYFLSVFSDPTYVRGMINSLIIAICTTTLCLLISLPLAVLTTRYIFPGKTLLSSLLLVPLILPPFVGAIGLTAILGRFGALNALLHNLGILQLFERMGMIDNADVGIDYLGNARLLGVIIMEALHLYPIAYLNITAALANLDPSLDEAALNMGASRFTRFRKITLPLIMPGVFAGATIVFIWSFTELGTPLMLSFREVTPVQVFEGIKEISTNPRPFALVVVMLVVSVVLYALGKWAFGGRAFAMQSKASTASQVVHLRGIKGMLASGLFIFVITLAILPHIGVVFCSFTVDGEWYRSVLPQQWTSEHYANALTHELAIGSIRNSLYYSTGAMILCVIAGLAVAYLNVRCRIYGAWLLDSLSMLPLAVPGLVMAFGYVAMSLSWPFRDLGIFQVVGENPNPVWLLIIAYAVRRLPYVVRSATAGLEQTSGMLEEAALNLGASTMTAIRKIVLPLIMANLIAGGILAFSFAMLEVSDSLILAQQDKHYPITKAIFTFFNRLGDGLYIASAMGVWGMALLTVTLVGASFLMGKRLGAIFRV